MAEYDGSIIIDTQIETDGFKAGKKEIESAARHMGKSLSDIGDKARLAAQKQIDAFVKQNQAYAQQEKKVDALKEKWDELRNQKEPTTEYADTLKELSKLESALDRVIERQIKFTETGGNVETHTFKNMEYDIESLTDKIEEAKRKKAELESSGKAYTAVDTSAAEEKYLAALQKQQQMHASLGTSYESLKLKAESFGDSINNISNSMQFAADNYEKFRIALEELKGTTEKIFGPVQKLKDVFSIGGDEVSGYNKLNSALDELKNSTGRAAESIKNSFEAIKESPTSVIASLGASVLDIGNRMNTAVVSAMGNAVESLGTGIGKIVGLFKYMGHSIGSAISSSVEVVKEKLAGLAASMISVVAHPIDTLKNLSKSAANSIKNILSSGIGNAFESIKQKAAGVATSIINGILHPLQALKSTLPVLNRVVSILKNIGTVSKNISKSIGRGLVTGFKKIGSAAKSAAKFVGNSLVSALRKAKSGMQGLDKQTKKTSSGLANFFKSIFLYGTISKILSGITSGAKEGLNNLVMYSDRTNDSMSMLMSSLTRLKNSFATAFAPILNVVAPILSKFMDMLSMAATKVGMFFAALTGQKTMEQAIAVQQDYRESLNGSAKAAKKAEKETDKYLSGLDEIRRWESNKDEDEEDELTPEDMFTTVPVEGEMSDLADKVKDIFSKIFAPLKEAWNREGKFVMDSWKYALKEVWKLAKDIGRDFLKVWNQEATIKMLADMLHIIGDIGLVVGNLAGKFREAWNANNVGLHILENIRDIFAVIVHNLREAADYTVEWSKTLDFTPLLQGVERLTASLVPFFDFVSGTLADFYTQFILPLTSWTLSEAGLPRLLNILSSFMESIDWEGLRGALKSLYQALEPYAEEIGNGLLDFIEKIKDEGVEFFNTLPGSIQRAADALRNGDLPAAFEEFGSISGEAVRHAFNMIRIAIESINWGEIGTLIGSFINGIDWMAVGQSIFSALATAVNAAIDLIYNFITTTDWIAIGAALGTNISNAWASIDWKQAGAMVGEAFKSFFDFIAETIENIDWIMVGQTIKDFLLSIDWVGIAESVYEFFGAALGAAFGLLAGFIGGLIADGVTAAKEYFQEKIEECGGNVVLGIFKGINDAIAGIAAWIYEHLFKPFIDGFKKAFGIHSPSTVMQEQGKFIMQGLLNGISSLVSNVISIFSDIKKQVLDKWNEIKTNTKETWDRVGNDIKSSWETIKTNVKTGIENAKTNVKSGWDNIKTNTSNTWESVKSSVRNGADNVKTSIATAWDNAKTKTDRTWDNLKSTLHRSWDDLKTQSSTAFGGIADTVSRAWDGLRENTSRAWEGLGNVIKSPVNAIIRILNGLIRGVATCVNNIAEMLNSLHIDIPEWVPKIGGGKLGFSLPTWTPGQIPYLASGAVIPPNKEFMAVLGDQKHGTNIEAPESLIRKILREEMRGLQAGGGSYRFIANVNRRVLFDELIEEAQLRQTVSGRNPFEMA